jgi:BirA family biotin operon repressor/biotin-[acetyl-CoA-carboxylase] ligase
MLPQGIYLFSDGLNDLAKPFPRSLDEKGDGWDVLRRNANDSKPVREAGLSFEAMPSDVPAPLFVCGECGSTMDVGAELLRLGLLPEWGGVACLVQQSGRGQMRREWLSPQGNLYLTLRWPDSPGGEWGRADSGLQSVVLGWCVIRALEELEVGLELKWPNDILQKGRKVAGILLEDRHGALLAGVGVNLRSRPEDAQMRRDAACAAGVLLAPGGAPSVPELLALLVNRAKNIYESLIYDFSPREFLSLAESRLAWMGREVLVREGEQPASGGRVVGLNADGGLVLTRNGVESVVRSGSVSPV